GGAQRDRQAALFAARLERRAAPTDRPAEGLMLRASFGGPFNPAATPFRMGGAFEATRDFGCLAQAVYYEARGEGQAGQAAVAQVVLNRVRHRAYPKTVCGVVFQRAGGGCQFSFACDGSMRRGKEQAAWRRAKAVAAQALSGSVMTAVGSATSFHTTGVSPGWGGLVRVAQIGSHIFYRSGGASGFIQGAKPYIGSAREMVTQVDKPAYAYTVLGPSSRESGLMLASNVTTVAPKEPVAVPAAKDAPKAESAAATPTVEEPVKSAS
ncbi:MAG: cell wall hydrolase, partial [Caulobacteraceae bacterium]